MQVHLYIQLYQTINQFLQQMESNFDYIENNNDRNMIETAYQAVKNLELIDWLKTFKPDRYGFALSLDLNISRIMQEIDRMPEAPGHSGFSFNWTMRELQYIVVNGIEAHKKLY